MLLIGFIGPVSKHHEPPASRRGETFFEISTANCSMNPRKKKRFFFVRVNLGSSILSFWGVGLKQMVVNESEGCQLADFGTMGSNELSLMHPEQER